MAVRTILHYPDKRLRNPAQKVTRFDAELKSLVDDMAETMYAAPGVWLAAPQIGVALRVFVIDVRVRAQDVAGQTFELEADGLLAIAIQHENDHLEGKLLVDHLSLLRRRLVHRAMVKRASADAVV